MGITEYLYLFFFTYLTDGATMTPINMSLEMTSGCEGGISKMCFRKKVFSSDSCQKMTSWQRAKKRMYVHVGSSQRTGAQLSGVNWSMARFILPDVLDMSLKQVKVQIRKQKWKFLWQCILFNIIRFMSILWRKPIHLSMQLPYLRKG